MKNFHVSHTFSLALFHFWTNLVAFVWDVNFHKHPNSVRSHASIWMVLIRGLTWILSSDSIWFTVNRMMLVNCFVCQFFVYAFLSLRFNMRVCICWQTGWITWKTFSKYAVLTRPLDFCVLPIFTHILITPNNKPGSLAIWNMACYSTDSEHFSYTNIRTDIYTHKCHFVWQFRTKLTSDGNFNSWRRRRRKKCTSNMCVCRWWFEFSTHIFRVFCA